MRIGIGEVDITPEPGLPLMGNYRDDYLARGTHDPLAARAVVFRDGEGNSAAMLSVDVCMLDRQNVAAIRQAIAGRTGLAADDILVAATHTHSSLATVDFLGLPKADDQAIDHLTARCADAVGQAWRKLAPAELSIGYAAESRLGFNRRLLCCDGRTHMNWEQLEPDFVVEPLGPVDDRVATLWVRHGDRPSAALVHFGLHPAILAGDNWLYSADYPGYLDEALKRSVSPELTTLFFNGCCGDVNHLDYRDPLQGRGYQMTQRVGYMLAVAAIEAGRTAVPLNAAPVRVSRQAVSLPRLTISDEQVRWSREVLARSADQQAPGQVDGLPDELYARQWLRMHEQPQADDPVEVMVMRLGDAAVVALPGEVFCETGLAIRRASPAPHTLVVELANDAVGYLPPRRAFEQGGYEPTPGSTMYQPGAVERLVDSALEQLGVLFERA
jgi:hypothetical protein